MKRFGGATKIEAMSDSKISILDQYRQQSNKVPLADLRDYKAYGADPPRNRTPMIAIEYSDGTKGLMAKHYLVEVICTSSQYLSLVFTTGIIALVGENLDGAMLEKLQEEEIRSLHAFNSQKHNRPADDEPIITSLKRVGFRQNPKEKAAS